MKKFFSAALLSVALIFSGCGESTDIRFPIVDPPFAVNDGPYTVDQGGVLNVPPVNGVLVNDITNGALPDFPALSVGGGTVDGNDDGSFTYTPTANFTGPDTFTYFLENEFGISSAIVTIQVDAVAVNGYFVDSVNGDDATANVNGGLPYETIQQAVLDAPEGADIVVRPGNYSGSVTLKADQRLLGSGSTLVNAQGDTRPVLTGPVVLNDGNTLDFLRIQGTSGPAVDGDGQNDGTVTNCEFANTTAGANPGAGVRGADTRGSWTINNNTFENLDGSGIVIQVLGSNNATYIVRNNTMRNNSLGAVVMVSEGTSNVKAQVQGNTFAGNNSQQGDAFEIQVRNDSTIGLDLEDNSNDDAYDFFVTPAGTGGLSIEQFNELDVPKPNGAGNTGAIQTSGKVPNPLPDGTLFP